MRTSGGRGFEGWIVAIPLIAVLAAASLSHGGVTGVLYELNSAIREVWTAVAQFVHQAL